MLTLSRLYCTTKKLCCSLGTTLVVCFVQGYKCVSRGYQVHGTLCDSGILPTVFETLKYSLHKLSKVFVIEDTPNDL